jgi:hypothetical protein
LPGAGVIPTQQPAQIGETLPAHAGAAGNTEGKIMDLHDPRNDSGVRSLDGAKSLHKTPALNPRSDLATYISGYVDGEGCFCVSFQPSRRHRFGWEVRPSFSVSQNAERSELLTMLKNMWDCGSIRPDRSDRTLKFEVRKLEDLMTRVLPHFRTYPLISSKQADVVRFDQVCCWMSAGRHLERSGFVRIVRLAMEMNPSGKRKYSESDILKSF